jgi:hypothetical protein
LEVVFSGLPDSVTDAENVGSTPLSGTYSVPSWGADSGECCSHTTRIAGMTRLTQTDAGCGGPSSSAESGAYSGWPSVMSSMAESAGLRR